MKVTFNVEYELIKDRVYDEDIEIVAEYTYVVPAEWLRNLYTEHLINMFHLEEVDFDDFLDIYDPEVEGTAIYYLAKSQRKIIEEGWSAIANDDEYYL